MRACLDLAAEGGRVLVAGDYGSARADFAWNQLLHHEISLIGSCASAGAWPEAVRIAAEGDLPLEALITHQISATEYGKTIELARSHDGAVIKVVLTR